MCHEEYSPWYDSKWITYMALPLHTTMCPYWAVVHVTMHVAPLRISSANTYLSTALKHLAPGKQSKNGWTHWTQTKTALELLLDCYFCTIPVYHCALYLWKANDTLWLNHWTGQTPALELSRLLLDGYFCILLVYHCALYLWNANRTMCACSISHPPCLPIVAVPHASNTCPQLAATITASSC